MNFRKNILAAAIFLFTTLATGAQELLFVEAESFTDRGGWVIDQQSMDVMGSAYLMAHGLGTPVKDAKTTVNVPSKGTYRIWVRTRDWASTWGVDGAPGKFRITINNNTIGTTFGAEGTEWHWQNGGEIRLNKGLAHITMHDLTGFNGRCDAIILTKDKKFIPPNQFDELTDFRQKQLGFGDAPVDAGDYDLVVVGGGVAGITTAITAARLGSKVALIQNRPVLGGNNSSEIRVGLSGDIHQEPYTNLGSLVDEIGPIGFHNLRVAKMDSSALRSKKIFEIIDKHPEKTEHNGGPSSNYNDDKKLRAVQSEQNISLFLNTHILKAQKEGDRIVSVTGRSIITGEEFLFRGKLFADCTGDGNLGYLAGADYRVGREAKSETGEPRAPDKADQLVMGTSIQWNSLEENSVMFFPDTRSWAVEFNEDTSFKVDKGDWDWETGFNRDQVREIETIRDYALRVTFGNWDFIKNRSVDKKRFSKKRITWVAYIGGKRESRRLLGDVILKEQDIFNLKKWPDGSFTTTWDVDLHYPLIEGNFTEEAFRSRADMRKIPEPYQVPYRVLYSRNVSNMFMAGRNISVTHVALGTIRVQRTTGMMGEVIGMAASVCKKHDITPRGVYETHFNELQELMEKPIGRSWWLDN